MNYMKIEGQFYWKEITEEISKVFEELIGKKNYPVLADIFVYDQKKMRWWQIKFDGKKLKAQEMTK